MKRRCLAAWMLACSAMAQDVPRTLFPDAGAVMRAALDAPGGNAQGILAGDAAQAIGARFKTTSPILIDVTTLQRYAQPGCSRLQVVFAQDGVLLPGATAPRRQTVAFGIDVCRDGQPPRSRAVR